MTDYSSFFQCSSLWNLRQRWEALLVDQNELLKIMGGTCMTGKGLNQIASYVNICISQQAPDHSVIAPKLPITTRWEIFCDKVYRFITVYQIIYRHASPSPFPGLCPGMSCFPSGLHSSLLRTALPPSLTRAMLTVTMPSPWGSGPPAPSCQRWVNHGLLMFVIPNSP